MGYASTLPIIQPFQGLNLEAAPELRAGVCEYF
jgi:hypothetical protein